MPVVMKKERVREFLQQRKDDDGDDGGEEGIKRERERERKDRKFCNSIIT